MKSTLQDNVFNTAYNYIYCNNAEKVITVFGNVWKLNLTVRYSNQSNIGISFFFLVISPFRNVHG